MKFGPERLEDQIVAKCANELAALLGRPRDEIIANGVVPEDFATKSHRVTFADDSFAVFKHSFFVRNDSKRLLAIFTEHCGYFLLPQGAEIEEVAWEDVATED